MFHYSLRVTDKPKMSEIRILNLCHKKLILVDIYRQSLLNNPELIKTDPCFSIDVHKIYIDLNLGKPLAWVRRTPVLSFSGMGCDPEEWVLSKFLSGICSPFL